MRWASSHPVLGAVLAGLCWGTFFGLWMGLRDGDFGWTVPSALVMGVLLFGPIAVWLARRDVRRWDAKHPTE